MVWQFECLTLHFTFYALFCLASFLGLIFGVDFWVKATVMTGVLVLVVTILGLGFGFNFLFLSCIRALLLE